MARNVPVGKISFEAQVKGKDLLPLPIDISPTVYVKRTDKVSVTEAKTKEPLKFDLRCKGS